MESFRCFILAFLQLTQRGSLSQPTACPARRGCRSGLSAAEILSLPGQQAHGQAVGEQHHAQRYVEADNGADELVHRIRNLARAVNQHRGVILESKPEAEKSLSTVRNKKYTLCIYSAHLRVHETKRQAHRNA